jgi:hypothetical protein
MLAALPTLIEQACDPDIEWVEDPQRADGRIYRGHAGVRESWERWLEDFDAYGFEVERITRPRCRWPVGVARAPSLVLVFA